MYLKTFETLGFKSFAGRTRLQFGPGLTAIVGPNGCGKSNVSDAVRWVLGEQSAKALRGSKMEDCIFNGTDKRKPLGMAEVNVTFADCEEVLGTEYNEITISRRVFRSGEGQYFINKTPCRLKDIQRMFMDTGVGTNSYSLMEQGRIDQVLSARPEDRRTIFEEASGIMKFKVDKKEAIRKLEYTEANLLRLADVIREVKRQIGSLRRQAGKARRYKSFKEELRKLDVFLNELAVESRLLEHRIPHLLSLLVKLGGVEEDFEFLPLARFLAGVRHGRLGAVDGPHVTHSHLLLAIAVKYLDFVFTLKIDSRVRLQGHHQLQRNQCIAVFIIAVDVTAVGVAVGHVYHCLSTRLDDQLPRVVLVKHRRSHLPLVVLTAFLFGVPAIKALAVERPNHLVPSQGRCSQGRRGKCQRDRDRDRCELNGFEHGLFLLGVLPQKG